MNTSPWLFDRSCTDRETCLRNLLVSLVPSVFLIAVGPIRLWILLKRRHPLAPELIRNRLYFVKLTTLILLLFTSLAQLVLSLDLLLLRISNTLSLLIAIALHHVEYTHNPVGSGVLLFYWLSILIINGVQWCIQHVSNHQQVQPHNTYMLFEATNVLSLIMLILESCNRPTHTCIILELEKDQSPCSTANIFERLLFSWVSPLMQLSSLSLDDLWLWKDPCDKRDDSTCVVSDQSSLTRLFVSITPGLFVLSGVLQLIHGVIQLALPLLLWKLLQWVTTHTVIIQSLPEPFYHGGFLAGSMFIASIAQSLVQQQYFHLSSMMGMSIFQSLSASIYHKVLVPKSQHNETNEVANLVLKDAQRVKEACSYVHMVWSTPLQVVSVFAATQYILGIHHHTWIGVVVIIFAVPINMMLGSLMRKWRLKQSTHKQKRLKILGSVLDGIKAIKLHAWESALAQKICAIRNQLEVGLLRKTGMAAATGSSISNSIVFFVSLLVFIVHALSTPIPLSSDKVFVCLSLFRLLQSPCMNFPNAISAVRRASTSMKRIHRFLTAHEIDLHQHVTHENRRRMSDWTSDTPMIEMDQVKIPDINSSISLRILKGEIVGVVGHSPAILNAILGNLSDGHMTVRGSIAYIPHTPWVMQDASLCDNIVFGHRWEPDFYRSVLNLCELPPDAVPSQHAMKISLARALYCRADIYVFDDPSCLERELFQRIVLGILRNKTRVIATRSFSHLYQLNRVLMVSTTGEIVMDGSFGELMSKHHATLYHIMASADDRRNTTKESNYREIHQQYVMTTPPPPSGKHAVDDDDDAKGNQPSFSISTYIKACSLPGVIAVIAFQILAQVAQVSSTIWLQAWDKYSDDAFYYLGVYAILGSASLLLEWVKALLLWVYCVGRSAVNLHTRMLYKVLRSPMTFFQSTTTEMILARFNQDQEIADRLLPKMIFYNTRIMALLATTTVVIACSTPFFLLIVIPLGFLYIYLQRLYLVCDRQLKRLDHESKSALYIHLAESTLGANTIRAYHKQQWFHGEYVERLNDVQRVHFASVACNRWLAVRIEILGSMVMFAAAMLAVIAVVYVPSVDVGLVGMSLFYALGIPQLLTWALRSYCEIELHNESLERVQEYTELPTEEEYDDSRMVPVPVHPAWPTTGNIEFRHYTTNLLHNVSLNIQSGETISIIGADKHTFAQSLFQLERTPPLSGSIHVDGVDITHLDVYHLRSRVAWVGSEDENAFFSGTIRENLDPFGYCGNLTLWDALASVRLETQGGWDAPIEKQHFTPGEKYLFGLARALLRRPRIVVLEDPTTRVDTETADRIQQVIRERFDKCTVLMVTQKLDTVMESKWVLVVDNGVMIDFTTPQHLLKHKGSLLFSLADSKLC
ncbi:multidrug resistance-associated protein 1-like [Lichtheimia corymbifera JMRC:FSU:9682]|uniref:Multidrug resistance-associated protein 1-like n=1 Tax=Lichtheimia corymbifera JMRC:FSU:9682 TaxID=1263082 RepID=A0A068RJH5_9FUNG|nr:multidrug resistance-associated protein 1-like [Lichtheimia corymbifera JMRC:FSU:9682]